MSGKTTIQNVSGKGLAEGELNKPDGEDGGRLDLTNSGVLKKELLNLLLKIDELGSIVRAAKAAGISYKIAWDTIIAISNDCGRPLVCRFTINKGNGVTRLTNEGKKIVTQLSAGTKEGR